MSFIQTIPADQATGTLRELYDQDYGNLNYIPDYTRVMSLRPEVIAAWRGLMRTIRSNMRLRRFELVTLAAAASLHCVNCMLAHGAILRKNFFSAEQLIAIVQDFRHAGLEPVEVALMEFAQKISLDAHAITQNDIDGLRELGLSDTDILDVTLAAAARNFFSRAIDALGAEPQPEFIALEEPLRRVLMGDSDRGQGASLARQDILEGGLSIHSES